MKAILIEKFVSRPEDLQPTDIPPPKPWTPTSLLIRVTHASLTHVDLLYAQGKHQNNRRHVKPPFVLGTEFAGVVLTSPAFSRFRPGDRVFGGGLGAYAEQICVEEAAVRKVPVAWTNAEACAVGASGAVSWGALCGAAALREGETVLVTGAAGGLGVMACQIALAVGARVIGVVGDAEKERAVRGLGVKDVVRYNVEGWEQKVLDLTGEGVDIVYDAVGMVESSVKCLRYAGRVVVVGFAGRGGVMENLKVNRVLLKSATVVGYRFGEHGRRFPHEVENIWENLMKMVEAGNIKPIVYKEKYLGLKAVPRGLIDMESRQVWGRAIVTISDEADFKTNEKHRL